MTLSRITNQIDSNIEVFHTTLDDEKITVLMTYDGRPDKVGEGIIWLCDLEVCGYEDEKIRESIARLHLNDKEWVSDITWRHEDK